MTLTEQILSQLNGDVLGGLRKADRLWQNLREQTLPVPGVVTSETGELTNLDWDVVVSGGTLGIAIATALQLRGRRVVLLERGKLRGRDQEWNISRDEFATLVEQELLTPDELQRAIATEYNPARIYFPGSPEICVRDVLNIGVDPVYLLETLKNRFLAAGGQLLENTPFNSATIHPNGVQISAGEQILTTRLLIDAMGHFSPIVRQVRNGKTPDAVCLVVGSCATGYPENSSGDLIASFTPAIHQCQYFWEAFPARDGRTTYLFTYLDADPQRFSLEFLFEEYLRLLPEYQQVQLDRLQFQRALFGFFPCYQDSPLKTPFNRILPVGDSSGSQSPLSFGGFGATIRHLQRLTNGIDSALEADALSANALAGLQPYQPNLSVTWLFQRAMSMGMQQNLDPQQINQLLAVVFPIMDKLGDEVLRPFLQDVVQFSPLTQTLIETALSSPGLIAKVVPQVGLGMLLNWMRHYLNLGVYTGLYAASQAVEITAWIDNLPPKQRYYGQRLLEAWQYGSGKDYRH
ncbi:MAG: FAD-binding oxidoreductase [Desertifilum sp. SIO1I2]|nr:FAD-binding oxidoreductase [Desertifilum sp. SIO1I2]